MNRKFFKRTLSFAMAAAVSLTTLCGITSVSVAAEETITDVYRTIFSDDFESGRDLENKKVYPSGWQEITQFSGPGVGEYIESDGNYKYKMSTSAATYSFANSYRISNLFAKPITSGKHKLSFDISVPDGMNTASNEMWFEFSAFKAHSGETNITLWEFLRVNGNGDIMLSNSVRPAADDVGVWLDDKVTAEKMLTGVKLETEFDFDNKKETFYVDGKKIHEGEIKDNFTSMPGFQFLIGGATSETNVTPQAFIIDNVKFETANDPISVSNVSVVRGGVEYSADNAPVDAKQIKIKFDKDPGSEIIKNITLNDGTNDVALTGSYDSTIKTYSATFSGLEVGKNYTLKIDKGIMGLASDYSKTFSPVSVPWKTTFSDDFESGKDLENKSVYPSGWQEITHFSGPGVGEYIEADGNYKYKMSTAAANYAFANSYRISNLFAEPITSGKHKLSFDISVPDGMNTASNEMWFEFSAHKVHSGDTNITSGEFLRVNGNGDIMLSNAVRTASDDVGVWLTDKVTAEKILTGVKLEAEFDFNTGKEAFYVDGTKIHEGKIRGDFTSIPGFQFLIGGATSETNVKAQAFIIDNVKFETVGSPISVSSVKFTKYGKEYDTTNVPTGATGVKVIFSDDVTDYVKDCVTLKSGENNVTVNGTYDKTTNTFTGTFDALGEETAYILTVGKNALFTAEDYTTGFTTKGGIQLNNITFTPGEGNAVSVNYDLTRFSGSGTAVVIAAVYDSDRVVQAVSDNVTFGSDGSGKGTLNVSKTESQTLKVFVWDSLNSLKALFPVHPMTSGN